MTIKTIWICGIGGVGGYFGGLIANRLSLINTGEQSVFFLARGAHLVKIKQDGLELHTSEGAILNCIPSFASDNVREFLRPDLCLICVKSYDLNDLIQNIKDHILETTILIPLMNGFDIYDRIRRILNKGIVLPSCVYVGSHIETPGSVIQSGNPGFFFCGPDPTNPEFNNKDLLDVCENLNILANWTEDPYPRIWQKYLLVASFALVCAHEGKTMGAVIENEKSLEILKGVMAEILAIAKRKGILLPENIIKTTIEFCKDYPDVKPSYQRDVERGGKNEGDIFGGAIIGLGKELNIPTPITESIYQPRS